MTSRHRVELWRDESVRLWRLIESEQIDCANGATLTIPEGTTTDLGSVPRFLWWLIAPHEIGTTAVVVHDWLYQHAGSPPQADGIVWTRQQADRELLYHGVAAGVAAWRAFIAYLAVRAFGWVPWRRRLRVGIPNT